MSGVRTWRTEERAHLVWSPVTFFSPVSDEYAMAEQGTDSCSVDQLQTPAALISTSVSGTLYLKGRGQVSHWKQGEVGYGLKQTEEWVLAPLWEFKVWNVAAPWHWKYSLCVPSGSNNRVHPSHCRHTVRFRRDRAPESRRKAGFIGLSPS